MSAVHLQPRAVRALRTAQRKKRSAPKEADAAQPAVATTQAARPQAMTRMGVKYLDASANTGEPNRRPTWGAERAASAQPLTSALRAAHA